MLKAFCRLCATAFCALLIGMGLVMVLGIFISGPLLCAAEFTLALFLLCVLYGWSD